MKGMELFGFSSWSGAVYNPEGQDFNLFSSSVYSKGGWVLHTLRGAIGDSAFFRSLRKWRELYAEQSATTADFQAAVESVVGRAMGWFFDEWIYGPGWPTYAHSFRWQGGTLFVKVYQQQPLSWQTYTMPIQLRARKGGKDTTFVVWDSLRTQLFVFPLAFSPDSVSIDPDDWILKQRGSGGNGPWPEIPARFDVPQNYPNPFNPGTTIRYDLPALSEVSLQVFDILGREVATLVDGNQLTGTYGARFDGSGLASGVYIYRLRARPLDGSPALSSVGKMILVR
jgi:hypothetical protein